MKIETIIIIIYNKDQQTVALSRHTCFPALTQLLFAAQIIELGISDGAVLLLFELFQFVGCVLIFGIELEAFAIVVNGLLFLTVLRIGLGQAVIGVA